MSKNCETNGPKSTIKGSETGKCNCRNQRFDWYRRKALLCDITLKNFFPNNPLQPQLQQEGVKAHKLILAKASPFFFEIFTTQSVNEINVGEIDLLTLEHLVNYIYTRQLILSDDNVFNIFNGSKKLKLARVARKCEEFLIENLSNQNIWQRFKLAQQMASHQVQHIIFYVQTNWQAVTSDPAFLELTFVELKSLISVNNPSPDLTLSMFNSIQAWFRYHEETRKSYIVNLLSSITLTDIPFESCYAYFSQISFDDLEFVKLRANIYLYHCLAKRQENANSQETLKLKMPGGFSAPIKEEPVPEDDDVIILPSPSQMVKIAKSEIKKSVKNQPTVVQNNNPEFTPTKRNKKSIPVTGFHGSIKEDPKPEDDDVIILTSPSQMVKIVKSEVKTSVKNQSIIIQNDNQECTPTKVTTKTTPAAGCHGVQSSPYNLSRKKTPQCKSVTPRYKKARLDNSLEDFKETSLFEPGQSFGSCVNYFLQKSETQTHVSPENEQAYTSSTQGRLYFMEPKSLATFDIRLSPQFTVSNSPDIISFADSDSKKSSLIYHSNKIYNVGGVAKNKAPLDRVDCLDLTDSKQWEAEDKLLQARFSHTTVVCNDFLYVIGGSSGKKSLRSVERFNPAATKPSWVNVKPMALPRESHGAVAHNGKMYAMGGYQQASDGTEGTCLDSMECYDPQKDVWSLKPSMHQKRCGMAVAVYKEKLYVIGGGSELNSTKPSTSVQVYNFKTEKWTNIKCLNRGRQYGSAVVIDGHLFVIGGDNPVNPTIEVFIPGCGMWEMFPGTLSSTGSYRSIAVKATQ